MGRTELDDDAAQGVESGGASLGTTGGAQVSVTIATDGQPLDGACQLVSIDVWLGVNKLPRCRIVVADGSPGEQTFPISETSALIPGRLLTVSLGYDGQERQVFSGIIFRQSVQVWQDGPSRLVVEATDKAMVMTLAPRNAVFEALTDSDIIKKLIAQAGLKGKVAGTSVVQPSIVQYHATDWDMMLMRARVNSMVVTVASGAVTVAPPDTAQAPVLTLTYGDTIVDFRVTMDASTQIAPGAIASFSWDPAGQGLLESAPATASVEEAGNISSADLAGVFGISHYSQQTAGTLDRTDLTGWSSARLMESMLAKICGEVRFQGSALAAPGCTISLAGLGDRFNGKVFVRAVHHRVADGLWETSAEFGLPPDSLGTGAAAPAAAGTEGQIPAVPDLQTGIVMRTDGDPAGEFRVLVALPLLQAGTPVWARLASLYASQSVGAAFYPEVGDEVVLAFMNGDPRFPVIVGSLYSSSRPPPVAPDKANDRKTITTRSKLRIDFMEKEPAIQIVTPGGRSVRLDDGAGTIVIQDSLGNKVTMAPAGLALDSVNSLTLSARDISLAAADRLSLSGAGGVEISGLNVTATADGQFAAKGMAEAKLTSDAIVTVVGGFVKIN